MNNVLNRCIIFVLNVGVTRVVCVCVCGFSHYLSCPCLNLCRVIYLLF